MKHFFKLLLIFWGVQIVWNVGFSWYATAVLEKYGATWRWFDDPSNWWMLIIGGYLWVVLFSLALIPSKRAYAIVIAIVVQCGFNYSAGYGKLYEVREQLAKRAGPPISMQD